MKWERKEIVRNGKNITYEDNGEKEKKGMREQMKQRFLFCTVVINVVITNVPHFLNRQHFSSSPCVEPPHSFSM
jgi:hypothetical protein